MRTSLSAALCEGQALGVKKQETKQKSFLNTESTFSLGTRILAYNPQDRAPSFSLFAWRWIVSSSLLSFQQRHSFLTISVVFLRWATQNYRRNESNDNAKGLGSDLQGPSSRWGLLEQMGHSREMGRGFHLGRLSGAHTNIQLHRYTSQHFSSTVHTLIKGLGITFSLSNEVFQSYHRTLSHL